MTRATPRHPATKAATDLRRWVQRWDGAPLPAVQVIEAWLAKVAAARPRRPSRAERINASLAAPGVKPSPFALPDPKVPADALAPTPRKRSKAADLTPAAGSQGDAS